MIEGFVGLIGAGKTMLAVQHAGGLALRRGALLASNIKVDVPGVETVQLRLTDDGLDLDQLRTILAGCRGETPAYDRDAVELDPDTLAAKYGPPGDPPRRRGLIVLVDEVGVIMPARFWQSFPVDLIYTLSQSRKMGIDFIYTAQDIEQVDSILRRLTQWVYKVRAVPAPTLERRESGRRPWFFVRDQWRPATVDKEGKRIARQRIRYRRAWELCYDTDELVRPPANIGKRASRSRATAGSRPQADAAAPLTDGTDLPA